MHRRRLVDSFNYAIEGFMYVLKTQRNMRLHFLLGVAVLLLGLYFNLDKIQLILLFVTISLVLLAEMFNTGVELVIDLITNEFHPLARIIKDVCAGAVLVASINAVFVGYLIFSSVLSEQVVRTGISYIRQRSLHLSVICLLLVLATVILLKLKVGRGRPLRGGMPSGHAAIAFSLWTIALFLAESSLLVFIVLALAFWVAQSRIRPGYHSLKEVLAGILLGCGITSMVFFILKR